MKKHNVKTGQNWFLGCLAWKILILKTYLYFSKNSIVFPHSFLISTPLKGYLCNKMITSQNVSSEAQVKNFFFISYESYVPFSSSSSFSIFNHPIIYQICDIMMSISTWDRVHFFNVSFESKLIKSPNLANWWL